MVNVTDRVVLTRSNGLRAVINPNGAYVESLLVSDGRPVLFPRQDMPETGKNRGGIPVCAPIFGPGESVGLNQHGFARNLLWEVTECTESEVKMVLDNPAAQAEELPPMYAGLSMELTVSVFDDGLRETLLLRNSGIEACTVNPAFHPYFPIPLGGSADMAEVTIDSHAFTLSEDDLATTFKVASAGLVADVKTTAGAWRVEGEGLPFFAIWSDSPTDYICVEPTTSGYLTDSQTQELLPGTVKIVSMNLAYIRAEE